MHWDEFQPNAHVLVCVVCSNADLERIHNEHWYRIPLQHAPRGLASEYLAFYATGACGPERWQIRWIAPIQAIRIVRRIELMPDQPNHKRAQERYYRVELGRPELLPTPIPAYRLRRITFIPTTLEALLDAHDVRELWQQAAEIEPADIWGAGIGRRGLR
jgi:hypothetical protein